jgi:hypothetical protein
MPPLVRPLRNEPLLLLLRPPLLQRKGGPCLQPPAQILSRWFSRQAYSPCSAHSCWFSIDGSA